METIPADLPLDCVHADAVLLGNGPGVSYERCTTCGSILIRQADRSWILRRTRAQA